MDICGKEGCFFRKKEHLWEMTFLNVGTFVKSQKILKCENIFGKFITRK